MTESEEHAEIALATLEDLVEYKQSEMKANEGHIESLQDENHMLEGQVKALMEAISQVKKKFGKSEVGQSQTPVLIGKYANYTLTDAIADVVNTHGTAPGLFVPEIIQHLKAEGFKSKATNLYASVYSVAIALIESGKIKESKKDGKRAFMKKP